MNEAEIRNAVDALMRAWSDHDLEGVLALFAQDCVYEDVALGMVFRGKEELRGFATHNFASVPDFRCTLVKCFPGRDCAAVENELSGTPVQDPAGRPLPGDRSFKLRGVTILEFEHGLIRRNADYWDSASAMQQLGLAPAPQQRGSA